MADDKDKKLLSDIKNYLDITWDDTLGGRPEVHGDGPERDGCH